MRKMKKGAFVLALGVTTLLGGCLGPWSWQQLLWGTALYAGQEYLLDNNDVFNIFSTDDTN